MTPVTWQVVIDAINAGVGNLLDVDPLLGPLADNGGPTMTHALLPGSPAIDAGDPAFVGPPYADQRGYYRVVDGDGDMTARIDMGAFEYASVAPLPGDGNLDHFVDGLDYLLWAELYEEDRAADPPGAPLRGDYNDDGVVDGLDYLVWGENFEASITALAFAGASNHRKRHSEFACRRNERCRRWCR
ncbi:MAG: choice-of-anchor Q domain-containing protein [Pirellulales bacterium]